MEKILIIDDEAFIRETLEKVLTSDGYTTFSCGTEEEALKVFADEDIDLVLLDLNLGTRSGLDVLRDLKELDPDILVIIITGYGTVESAVEALKLGAYDYIKKPFKADAIHLIVRLALETQHLKRTVKRLRREKPDLAGQTTIVGASPLFQKALLQVQEVAKHETPTVLITGESGTGKELIARAIHSLSPRKDRPIVEINCGSLPHNLLESELFGHERGAFTDAKARKIGLIEEANGGTLFLDEIGEMDPSLQVKLLRVLEDRKIRRIGGTRNIDVDIRIIAATNRDLQQAIEEKEFRKDLYYRLNVFPISLPPLRNRKDDIPRLLLFFLERFSRECGKNIKDISRDALEMLVHYSWPGNVRELRNVVERICIMQNEPVLTVDMLPQEITGEMPRTQERPQVRIPEEGIVLDDLMAGIEKEYITKAFEISDGNVAKTSRLLGVPRGTLRYKLEKYGLAGKED